jgi:hypothetical protein
VDRWTQAAGGRNRQADNLIAGLIPRIQRVSDPELAYALIERDQAMEGRARSLADQAVESGESWIQRLGTPPASPARRERWIREVSTIAAYRDRWHLSGQNPVGKLGNTISIEQTSQRQRALAAADRATALSRVESNQSRTIGSAEIQAHVDAGRGVEL